MRFLAVGLFYIEHTNEVYYMTIDFNNRSNILPNSSINDIKVLVNEINTVSSTLPFGAICVDVDVIIDMRGNIIWEHSGTPVYNSHIKLVSLEEKIKNEKDEK